MVLIKSISIKLLLTEYDFKELFYEEDVYYKPVGRYCTYAYPRKEKTSVYVNAIMTHSFALSQGLISRRELDEIYEASEKMDEFLAEIKSSQYSMLYGRDALEELNLLDIEDYEDKL